MFTSTSTVFKFWLLCTGAAVLVSQVHSRTLAGKGQEATTTLRIRGDVGRFGMVEENFSNRIRRDVLMDGGRWPTGSNITYRVERGPTRGVLKDADIGGIVKLALREWAPHCGLHFTQIHSGEANITILFESSPHLICPILNNPTIPANTDFPKHTQNVRVCFGDEWNWSLFYRPGNLQFYVILLHELGHALGLLHSNSYSSVMYANYHANVTDWILEPSTLRKDDISRMRNHYDIEGTNAEPTFDGTISLKTTLFDFFTADVNSRNKYKDRLREILGFSDNNTDKSFVEPSLTESSERPISRTNSTDKYFITQKEIYEIINE